MAEVDVVDYIICKSIELKNTYELYKIILYSLQRKDYDLFETIIEKEYIEISEYMQTSINTLREFKEHIKNTLEQPHSNGVVERNNNTCKLIKKLLLDLEILKTLKLKFYSLQIFLEIPKGV